MHFVNQIHYSIMNFWGKEIGKLIELFSLHNVNIAVKICVGMFIGWHPMKYRAEKLAVQ